MDATLTLDELKKQDYAAWLTQTKSLRNLLTDLRRGETWLKAAACTAFFASAFFMVKVFVGGDLNVTDWTPYQWMNAFLGLAITAIITAFQWFLYDSGKKGVGGYVAIGIVVFYGFFSETSQTMEREDSTVRERSEGSKVFQTTLKAVGNLAKPVEVNPALARNLARAEAKAAEAQTRIDNKNRCNGCVGSTFRKLREDLAAANSNVATAKSRLDTSMRSASVSQSAALASTLSAAKDMEYDEDKHYGMIRWIKDRFGTSSINAAFWFAIIIIGSFEFAFHWIGGYVNHHRDALTKLGRDKDGRRLQDAAIEDGYEQDAALVERMGITGNARIDRTKEVMQDTLASLWDDGESRVPRDTDTQTRDQGHAEIDDKPPENDWIDVRPFVQEAIESGSLTKIQTSAKGELGLLVREHNKWCSKKDCEDVVKQLISWLVAKGVAESQHRARVTDPAHVLVKTSFEKPDDGNNSFTGSRWFKIIYDNIRLQVLNGEIRPTVRPVTDAVTRLVQQRHHSLGINIRTFGKPQREQVAQLILTQLEDETVVTRNTEGGVGKPKYVLNGQSSRRNG